MDRSTPWSARLESSTGTTTFHILPDIAATAKLSTSIGICRSGSHLGRRINTDRFLILHEAVEKTLIDHLGLRYLYAHQIATRTLALLVGTFFNIQLSRPPHQFRGPQGVLNVGCNLGRN